MKDSGSRSKTDIVLCEGILDSGFHAVDSGFPILDSSQCATWILDSLVGFRIPYTGFQSVWNLDYGFVSGIPDFINWIPVSVELGFWIRSWDSGFHILDSSQCGIWILESFVGFRILYTGFQ